MPRAEFFARFGLFVARGLFDAALCERLRSEVRAATRTPATVYDDQACVVDTEVRSTKWGEVSPTTVSLVESRLLALKPKVEQHFRLPLTCCEGTQFLVYGEGDFYGPHRDTRQNPAAGPTGNQRQVSVVLFLNSESQEPREGCYGGGSLTFYGLMNTMRAKALGFPLAGEAGLLVAFPSGILHEVTPVTHGERLTIASWYV